MYRPSTAAAQARYAHPHRLATSPFDFALVRFIECLRSIHCVVDFEIRVIEAAHMSAINPNIIREFSADTIPRRWANGQITLCSLLRQIVIDARSGGLKIPSIKVDTNELPTAL